ncbi:unnamed protein product [Coffea canephora]|uniref:Uncharacterized protein n=1 Tax=Coffea canephora TaxID=49390 RepID=A0A068VEK2_COFCA|nr:unnamed protein product [Coffea canephora]
MIICFVGYCNRSGGREREREGEREREREERERERERESGRRGRESCILR